MYAFWPGQGHEYKTQLQAHESKTKTKSARVTSQDSQFCAFKTIYAGWDMLFKSQLKNKLIDTIVIRLGWIKTKFFQGLEMFTKTRLRQFNNNHFRHKI